MGQLMWSIVVFLVPIFNAKICFWICRFIHQYVVEEQFFYRAAYEKSVFCDMFHLGETGWRDCSLCHKPLHCGCVASRSLYECLDYGGVGCIGCANRSQPRVGVLNLILAGTCLQSREHCVCSGSWLQGAAATVTTKNTVKGYSSVHHE